jgi:hypothetical protein
VYENGLSVFVNGNENLSMTVEKGGVKHVLPPFGWLAVGNGFLEYSESSADGGRVDFVSSPEYIYLNTHGKKRSRGGLTINGSAAVRQSGCGTTRLLVMENDGTPMRLKIGEGTLAGSRTLRVEARDICGVTLKTAIVKVVDGEITVPNVEKAMEYVIDQ